MKIRRKITLTFSLLTSIVLVLSFSIIYFLTEHYTKNDFYGRLFEKADFTAQKYFEEDELSKQVYQEILEKNSKNLPEANSLVLNTINKKAVNDSLVNLIPPNLIKQLISGKNIKFQIKERQGVGLYYPDNQGIFIIVVTAIDKIGIQKQQNLLKILLVIFLCSIIFMYFIGQFYAKKVFAPVSHILSNVKRINATNLKLRLQENEGNDELTELSQVLNQMLERLDHSFDMQKNFIQNASHELKNPLTAIIGETEITLSKERSVDEYILSLTKVAIEAERLDFLTKNLLSLARTDFEINASGKKEIRIDELLWEIKDYFDKTPYKDRLIFKMSDLPDNSNALTIMGLPDLLIIALNNLIDNACKFSGYLPVEIKLAANDKLIKLSISDQGIGIPENEKNNLFQPFFRASNTHAYKGSGIGLTLAARIIKMHKGTLKIDSINGKSTVVKICFYPN